MANEDEELGRLRQGIDAIDDEVLRLISERAKLAQNVDRLLGADATADEVPDPK